MLPKLDASVKQERVRLYNNIAQIGNCTGRLSADLEIHPVPRILWEFEMLGENQPDASQFFAQDASNQLAGNWFIIDNPIAGMPSTGIGPQTTYRGAVAQARYGDLVSRSHSFHFYLPNARFQERNFLGQSIIQANYILKATDPAGEDKEVGTATEGRSLEIILDNGWSLKLETREEALKWLNPQKRNIGTRITTTGYLFVPTDGNDPTRLRPSLSMEEAKDILSKVSQMLSYSNGGYLGPLYIEGLEHQGDGKGWLSSSALALAWRTTPLELLGSSWLTIESDLTAYLNCYPSFRKMIANPDWSDGFGLILDWYFQAVQPTDYQIRAKTWPVVANAVGTALERLSYTILVLDENNPSVKADHELLFDIGRRTDANRRWNLGRGAGQDDISPTGKRLKLLLERIGLTMIRGYNDIDDVKPFLDVRNEATHPKPGTISDTEKIRLLRQGIQWIDEVLLWRLGYNGKYVNRSNNYSSSIAPRYDLATRDSLW